ncbi:dUTP diphosphatase [Psychrobacillus lasiicapitis]|uniref:dUTPase n=1 Tax=Psychrobacillus lasiicapitis TaxID=1636719 RepID=A0A544TA80_9BACI|nr:dUTP diphosphatase [Psychrobacillus lasiicapitis]TQR14371.1 dUTPase [Psychrobacillus lasiicapitis]GGA31938.1 hypothetical protein GCM10011384_21860 [Psychrobacillus lasiicapitis]
MNLSKLFETQKVLDERIMEQHPELRGQNNLDWKILALQVELGECANEWRGFKKWSNDQEPRNFNIPCHACKGRGYFGMEYSDEYEPCLYCDETGIQEKNPLLVEYVDCLHFILSIGLELDVTEYYADVVNFNIGSRTKKSEPQQCFKDMFIKVALISTLPVEDEFVEMLSSFTTLGDSLGFTEELIELAYFEKNKINHERQANGY